MTMITKTHFSPKHFNVDLKKAFKYLLIGETFVKDGKTWQYIGKDKNGNISAKLSN